MGLKMKVDLNFQKTADNFIFRLFLMLSMSQCMLNSHKSVVVKLISYKNLYNYYQFSKQLLLHEAVLFAKVDKFFAFVVGINRAAVLIFDLINSALNLDDL